MKKCFVILLIMLIGLLALSLNSCHKSVTSQTGTSNDLRTSPPAPPEGMVLIPAGEFQMGSNDAESDNYEQPAHIVYVDAFYIDTCEVTNAQYKRFVEANPAWQKEQIDSRFHDSHYLQDWKGNDYPSGKVNHPVAWVSWYGAMAYAKWAGKRLPTEAEWEKAARGGLVGKKYPWGDTITPTDTNYRLNIGSTVPVRSYRANGYGLYDMAGNIWEWCLDDMQKYPYFTFPRDDVARNPLSGANNVKRLMDNFTNVRSYRVVRGGSWSLSEKAMRVDHRFDYAPSATSDDGGFRCVKDVTP